MSVSPSFVASQGAASLKSIGEDPFVPIMPCIICAAPVACAGSRRSYLRTGRAYCSPDCTKAYMSRISSERMARTNRKYASARMVARNPMHSAEVREKVSAKLRQIGHCPALRAGNGALTIPQETLAGALAEVLTRVGLIVQTEHPVRTAEVATQFTGVAASGKIASCYKLDIAIPGSMIGIEVDGSSHSALRRQAEDALKTRVLESLGWTVLRFKNNLVNSDLQECVRQVLSIIAESGRSDATCRAAGNRGQE